MKSKTVMGPDKHHLLDTSRVVYKGWQPAKSAGFSARFRRLLSLLHESRYVKEMMFDRSHNRLLFTKLQLLKNLKKTLHILTSEAKKVARETWKRRWRSSPAASSYIRP